jgi:hypothetical protein
MPSNDNFCKDKIVLREGEFDIEGELNILNFCNLKKVGRIA